MRRAVALLMLGACGGLVEVPIVELPDRSLPDAGFPDVEPLTDDAGPHGLPDAQPAICPFQGGYCAWPSNSFIWCADYTAFWQCENKKWNEVECNAPGATNPLCNDIGACIGPMCVQLR